MKGIIPTLLLLHLYFVSAAQDMGVINGEARHFRIKTNGDTIDFIKLDTSLTTVKPVLLFLQGSLPLPLFFTADAGKIYMIGGGITNFDYKEIQRDYHLIVVSMPKTPVLVDEKNLNASYCYVPDSSHADQFDPAYVQADYLDNYVRRTNRVIRFLKQQPWVARSKFVLAGHSQGTKVAAKVALQNKNITHVGLFAANPFGRADQFIRQFRKQAEKGERSWEDAEAQMDSYYQYFRLVHNPDSLRAHPEYLAWKTFSEVFYDDWLKLDAPLYLAYGTADITADLCDLVPLFFIQEGKNNLTLKRYPRLDHNFFEVNAEGRPDYEKGHWREVMRAFLDWTAH